MMARVTTQKTARVDSTETGQTNAAGVSALRIKSRDLLQQTREIEIEHDGRIYRLRLTQSNKLILTA